MKEIGWFLPGADLMNKNFIYLGKVYSELAQWQEQNWEEQRMKKSSTIYTMEEGLETLRGRADGLMLNSGHPDLRG